MKPEDGPAQPLLPLPERAGARAWRPRIDRGGDRAVTLGGVVAATALLGLAVASLALPESRRLGMWLPLHLALAGGAATAIAALLPFFTATLVVAPPAPLELRAAALALVGGGAAAVAVGHAAGENRIATVGGVAYLLGVGDVALVAFLPLRRALGPRRRLVERAYAVALADVAVGASLATGFLGGEHAVLAAWGSLKPAHAWLNLFGFVTVVVAATLVHLAPTVFGGRIRPRRSARLGVIALASGPPIAAAGYATALSSAAALGPFLTAAGALLTVAGAIALTIHGIVVRRDAVAWTTDPDWHALTSGSLLAAPAWLAVAAIIASVRLATAGAGPQAWSFAPLAGPLVAGFVVQVLIGAWSHLVPAIGPGHPTEHARRRTVLGLAGRLRLIAWNGSVMLLTAGTAVQAEPAIRGAVILLACLAAISLTLLAIAIAGVRSQAPAS